MLVDEAEAIAVAVRGRGGERGVGVEARVACETGDGRYLVGRIRGHIGGELDRLELAFDEHCCRNARAI